MVGRQTTAILFSNPLRIAMSGISTYSEFPQTTKHLPTNFMPLFLSADDILITFPRRESPIIHLLSNRNAANRANYTSCNATYSRSYDKRRRNRHDFFRYDSLWPYISSIKRVRPFCICFYCICCDTRVGLRRILHPFRRVTAHISRHSAHNCEGESEGGLCAVRHSVNYTIFAALCVGFRGRFPPHLIHS